MAGPLRRAFRRPGAEPVAGRQRREDRAEHREPQDQAGHRAGRHRAVDNNTDKHRYERFPRLMPGGQQGGLPDMPPLSTDRAAQDGTSIASHSKVRLI
ncbi:hypothetical protein GCM10022251_56900 [Phytohabitans flavus]|uniref:Uncharacterized protein n=1 Tax=Phytohabitans flavus TaxID=1076124 RepID=A0A6F8XTR7_9ACTN|nr:hypothetical protein Pflav_036350 [Phytohabitans flavus]